MARASRQATSLLIDNEFKNYTIKFKSGWGNVVDRIWSIR